MNAGHILQVGSPKYVFNHPKTPFIADFMGFANLIHGTVREVSDGRTSVRTSTGAVVNSTDTESDKDCGRRRGYLLDTFRRIFLFRISLRRDI